MICGMLNNAANSFVFPSLQCNGTPITATTSLSAGGLAPQTFNVLLGIGA
jgi:hypothetical protein